MKRTILLVLTAVLISGSPASTPPAVFPLPQEMTLSDGGFVLTEPVPILLPIDATADDVFLARQFAAELGDRFGLTVLPQRVATLPGSGQAIVMGVHTNPLVRQLCGQLGLAVDATKPGPEGYVLQVNERFALVAGSDAAGAFYGMQSLRQLLGKRDGRPEIRAARIRDWPHLPFRGIRLYLPGAENLAFFKRFLRDFMALYKFNRVIIEMNACMRFDRHPELNAGWREFAKDLFLSRRERPAGPGDYFMNSSHHDTADGGVLEKSEVAEIVRFAREHHIDVIPEIPSLTHSYYLLTRHRELAEIQAAEWPDTFCPLDPRSYQLLFDVFDEYLEVMQPRLVHIGHDEWRMPTDLCPRCKSRDIRDLLVQDINKIHGYLKSKGVEVALWGDHFLENLRGVHLKRQTSRSGYVYDMPGALKPEQVQRDIPKDIVVLNWFWNDKQGRSSGEATPSAGEINDEKLSQWGFRQVWGNLTPELGWQNFAARSARRGVLGGASSSWAASTEFNFGKDLMWVFLGTQNMLWSRQWPAAPELTEMVQALMPQVRRRLGGVMVPSDEGDPIVPIDLREQQTARSAVPQGGPEPGWLATGTRSAGSVPLQLNDPASQAGKYAVVVSNQGTGEAGFPLESAAIRIGDDVSSLIFLHALAKPSGSQMAYRLIHNFPDAADLLGWYEVLYADGLTVNVSIRYGVNILEWDYAKRAEAGRCCYGADAIEVGKGPGERVTFFAYEWTNPRLGKVIQEVRLKGSRNFGNSKPFPAPPTEQFTIPSNAIMLRAISAVQRRGAPEPVRAKEFPSAQGPGGKSTPESRGAAAPAVQRGRAEFLVAPATVSPGTPVQISFRPASGTFVRAELTDAYYIAQSEVLSGFAYDATKKKSSRSMSVQDGAASLQLDTRGWPPGAHHLVLQTIDAGGRTVEQRPFAIKVTGPNDRLEISVASSVLFGPGTHFGRFAKLRDGTLLCADRFSRDGGQTWQPGTGGFGEGAEQLRDGSVLGLVYRCLPLKEREGWYSVTRFRSPDGRRFEKDEATMFVPEAKAAMGHAQHLGPLFMRSILERQDGSLVAFMAGWFKSDTALCPYGRGRPYSRSYVCESNDGGRTWRYLTTIGYEQIGSEGYNEGSMRHLPDGSWLAVMRTGNAPDINCQDNPIMWSVSRDEGRTWSRPQRTGLEGCYPSMAVLSDGLVVMSYGRPGAMIAFSADGGRTWSDITCVDATVSSGYTDVVELEPGLLLVGFGTRGYLDPQTGQRSDGLRLARVRYTRR